MVTLSFDSVVFKAMYDYEGRKYMDICIPSNVSADIKQIHEKEQARRTIPLGHSLWGNVLRVKIPYRYKRVNCDVLGITPVQELKETDEISNVIEFSGGWHTGMFWKFTQIGLR